MLPSFGWFVGWLVGLSVTPRRPGVRWMDGKEGRQAGRRVLAFTVCVCVWCIELGWVGLN